MWAFDYINWLRDNLFGDKAIITWRYFLRIQDDK